MEIKQGQIYGFICENGAGKTTLIRILAGLSYLTSGELYQLATNYGIIHKGKIVEQISSVELDEKLI